WIPNTIALLEKHKYHTTYCQVLLENEKRKNIQWLKRKEKSGTDNTHHNLFDNPAPGTKVGRQTATLLSRGIQTVMRLTSTNHFHLSQMADRKANILTSVNAIMISGCLPSCRPFRSGGNGW